MVVDCVEGVCVQTETVLRQAMTEKIKPVLMVNKVDRALFELQLDGEAIYQKFVRAVDLVNVIISNYEQPDMGDLLVHPSKGNVAFGSGKDNWGFSLPKFAKIYSKKFNIDEEKLRNKLWGDNYFDPETKKWTTEPYSESGKLLKRGFVQFIMDPIIKFTKSILEGDDEQIAKTLKALDLTLTKEEKEFKGKALLKSVMSRWINCPETLLEMIVTCCPSPKVAQKYRTAYLYEGPQDDCCAEAMRNCDPKGPLMVYISKMVPSSDNGRFYAFGRVFSGTVYAGQEVRIMGPNYVPGRKDDLAIRNIQRTVIMMGKNVESVTEVPCGNTVALVGIDKYIVKTGTISDTEEAHNIRVMKYSVSPVVRVAVQPTNPTDMLKFIEGLSKLSKVDSLVQVYKEDTGQFIIAGCGELHIEICLNDLEKEYAKVSIKTSEPIVTYKETVANKSSQVCLAKSSNKHNRLFCGAEPLEDELAEALEAEKISMSDDPKQRVKKLVDEFHWDKEEAQKIWTFGPETGAANVLVDLSKDVQYMNEIRDSIEVAFQWATKESVLCGESMRKVRVNILDAKIHSDNAHRGGGQIIEAARRVFYACELTAEPRLQEPVFQADITAPMEAMGGVYQCLNQRRGIVFEEEAMNGTPLNIVRSYLPVSESFGFTAHLRSLTGGRAFPQCVFHHWSDFNGDPLDESTKAHKSSRP